ncbi:Na-translocating system protein MpsC family protein [Microbacterium sp. APC 3898]|uniref:Na-translocating system protein MpsC family protein n=1 Tax=Planococcus notacanthi TaxID=3035188 RepID=A0ABT7ZKG2_9BACL|nr:MULTISPECIES: Na-translocating system protein MpsC family protein [Terrabacteria group]MDN3427613.1 Na-translocating system protein MpsC family protein [Planococcus sp. APC 4016]MDN3499164.1 Na-translocating system protein MpsC family protein [Microbacterium sp. APC 3898]
MPNEKTIHTEVGSYISTLLRDHFGKGPTSVFVTVKPPFITIHLRGFLAPTEKILMKQQEHRRVLETRDLLMNQLVSDIKLELWKIGKIDIEDVYADWNLDDQTGMILAIMPDKTPAADFEWDSDIQVENIREEVMEASRKAQKTPESTELYWLNKRTLLIERSGIFVEIEKELIKGGFIEELKLVKRPLERRLILQTQIEAILGQPIMEVFLDWNFITDKGYIVLLLETPK